MPLDLGQPYKERKFEAFYLPSQGAIEPIAKDTPPPARGPQTPMPPLGSQQPVPQQPQNLGVGQPPRGGFVNLPQGGVQQVQGLGIPSSAQAAPQNAQNSPQTGEQTPAWQKALLMISGGLEGFAAGVQGRVPTAVIMANQRQQAKQAAQTYLQNQQKLQMEQQKLTDAQAQLKQENKMNVLEAWRKGASELGPTEWKLFEQAIRPELEKHAPELLTHHDAVANSEVGRKNAAAVINDHPMLDADLQAINAQYDSELANVAPNKRAAILAKKETAIQTYLNSAQTTEKRHEYDASAAAQYISLLPPDTKKAMKGLPFDELVQALPNVKDSKGEPMPKFLQDAIKTGRPEIQRLLAQHGVITPLVAEEQAREARKPQDMGDDREAISHSLYQSKYGKNVRYTDLTEPEQKRVEQQLLINKRSVAEAGASVTADNRRLDETAQGVLSGLDLLEDIVDQINPNSKGSQFTKDEIAKFVGPIENRARATGQILLQDPRFAKFQSILNQRMRAQFEIGGKALTEGERKALDDALPTGKEPSLADYQEKIDATKRVVSRLRASRIKYGTSTVGELAKEKQYVEVRTTKSGKKLGKRADGTLEEIK